ncbi:hypothetical protein HQ560_12685 [bacterium]|nr:hypothetical protein [bacterium]
MEHDECNASEDTQGTPFAKQAAKASWMAPLIAIVLTHVVASQKEVSRLQAIPTVIGYGLLLLCGLVMGIFALAGLRKHGWRGILIPAIIGICLSAVSATATIWRIIDDVERRAQAATARGKEIKEAAETGAEAVTDYPGWVALAKVRGAFIGLTSVHHASPAARNMAASFRSKVSLINLTVVNTEGTDTLTIDPSSIRFTHADGTVRPALYSRTVLKSARKDADDFVRRFAGPHSVPRGKTLLDGLVFVPYAYDMSTVTSATLSMNGEDWMVEGKYLTPEEKATFMRTGVFPTAEDTEKPK